MKQYKVILVLMMSILIMGGCGNKKVEKSPMERIQERLTTMENYECTAEVTYISNKGENTYVMKQQYKMTGEYRIELLEPENVKGVTTVCNGEKVNQFNPRVDGSVGNEVDPSASINEILLGSFIKNYLQSEDVSIAVSALQETKVTVLEAVIPGNHRYLSTEKLWIDHETLNPVKMVIYDTDNKERIIVKYKDFMYNSTLEDTLFEILS